MYKRQEAALVTSGTATLETALFRVPQAVWYHTPIGNVIAFLKRHILKVKYISLVNLIANREVVKELSLIHIFPAARTGESNEAYPHGILYL